MLNCILIRTACFAIFAEPWDKPGSYFGWLSYEFKLWQSADKNDQKMYAVKDQYY